MGSLKRKIKRKESLKEVKKAKKNLKKALNATMGLPTTCSGCSADFDPIDDADTWMVSAINESVELNCPSCYDKIRPA